MKERMDWVDYGKGIGILLVVYAHLLSSAYHAGVEVPEHFFALSDSIIYSFHMPFFFFLSGLFAESSLQKRGAREYLLDKFSRMAYPYFLWSVLQVSVEVMFSSQTQKGTSLPDLLAIPYRPWGQFWFIYALFVMHAAYVLFSRFGKFSLTLMAVAGIGLFFFPIPINVAALPAFSTRFIFFVGGIVFSRYLLNKSTFNVPGWVPVMLVALQLGAAYIVFEYFIEPVRFPDGSHPFYSLFLPILGIIAFTSLSMYLAGRNILQPLKTLGVYSLHIYLVHMLAGVGTRVILLYGFHVQNWLIHIVFGVSVALFAPIALQRISTRMNFPYLFEFGGKRASSETR